MKISDQVSAVLSSLEVDYPGIVRMPKLERGLYLQVDKALQALGGKWDRKRTAHVFDQAYDDEDNREIIQARIDQARTSAHAC